LMHQSMWLWRTTWIIKWCFQNKKEADHEIWTMVRRTIPPFPNFAQVKKGRSLLHASKRDDQQGPEPAIT
jgi:hypothetical protein